MTTYPQRIAQNILPLSIADSLPEAFKEWFFTENIHDNESCEEECELCDQEKLRYQFEIQNKHTDRRLWVGSSCILKFQLQVFENGKLLDEKESEKKLEELKRKMRLDSCINALKKLAQSEDNDRLSNALDFYIKNSYLTPKYAFVVFWRLKMHKIDHSPSFFNVSLKKEKYKKDLAEMDPKKIPMIWPALTSSQKKIAISLGHIAPDEK
ncbi:hypothetical protein [Kosakonia cowanii]